MCRHHHRGRTLAIQSLHQQTDLELISEIERRGRLVEEQHFRRLRERAGDDDALFSPPLSVM